MRSARARSRLGWLDSLDRVRLWLYEAVASGDEINRKTSGDDKRAEEKPVHAEHRFVIALDYGEEKQQQGKHSG